jgi:uncharacterized protein YegL
MIDLSKYEKQLQNNSVLKPDSQSTVSQLLNNEVCFILDCSGSMHLKVKEQTMLDIMFQAFNDVYMQIPADKTVSVVLFADENRRFVAPANRSQGILKLKSFAKTVGGYTNMCAALKKGASFNPSSIVLITDGRPTDGIEKLFRTIHAIVQKDISVTCIPLPLTDEEFLQKLAKTVSNFQNSQGVSPKIIRIDNQKCDAQHISDAMLLGVGIC